MHSRSGIILLFFFVSLVSGAKVLGQERYVLTGFQSEVDRYLWLSEGRMAVRWKRGEMGLFHRFRSEAFGVEQLQFRDEEHLRAYVLWGRLRLTGRLEYYGQGQGLFGMLASGYRLALPIGGWLEPGMGAVIDGKPGTTPPTGSPPMRVDAGPGVYIRGLWEGVPAPSLEGRVRMQGNWYVAAPRWGSEVRLSGELQRKSMSGELGLRMHFVHLRRDAYRALSFLNREAPGNTSSEAVESALSDTLQGVLATRFSVHPFQVRGMLEYLALLRRFRTRRAPAGALFFDTDYNRQELDAAAVLSYERPDRRFFVELRRGVGVEMRRLANREALPPAQAALKGELLRQAGFDQAYLQWRTELVWPIRTRLRMRMGHLSRILRYDTPEGNPDDRDEVLHRLSAGVQYVLRDGLTFRLQATGSFYHTVYLKAQRSAENTRQYHLRLIPEVAWKYRPDGRLQVTSEIRTTYTVSDFPRPGALSSDRSARELRYAFHWQQQIAPLYRLEAEGSWSHLNLGMLLWERFAEVPLDTLRTYSGWLRLQRTGPHAVGLGWRWLIRGETQQATAVSYEVGGESRLITRRGRVWIMQYGPTCSVHLPLGGGRTLQVEGWLQRQHVWKQLFGVLPEEEAAAVRQAARRGAVRWIPYLTLRTRWDF